MKKIRSKVFLLLGLSLAVIGSLYITPVAQAAECSGVDTSIIDCKNTDAGAIREILLIIIDIMSVGIGILGAIGITVVGIQYLTASDNVQQTTKAKKRLYEIVIGLAVYVLLYGLIEWLMPGGKFSTATVEVASVSISVPGSGKPDSITTGSTIKLTPVLDPLDADNYSYTWESSDESIATVDKGIVTAKKAGKVTITVTTSNEKSDSIELTIVDPPKDPEPDPTPTPSSDPVVAGDRYKIGNALAVMHAHDRGHISHPDIQWAINKKYWAIECDLRSGLICSHESPDSGTPTFATSVSTFKNSGIKTVVDLKDSDSTTLSQLGSYIKNNNLQQWVIIQITPGQASSGVMTSINNAAGSNLEYWGLVMDQSSPNNINHFINNASSYKSKGMTGVNVPKIAGDYKQGTNENIKRLQNAGYNICMFTWVTFNSSEISNYNSLGVRYLMTNGQQ